MHYLCWKKERERHHCTPLLSSLYMSFWMCSLMIYPRDYLQLEVLNIKLTYCPELPYQTSQLIGVTLLKLRNFKGKCKNLLIEVT